MIRKQKRYCAVFLPRVQKADGYFETSSIFSFLGGWLEDVVDFMGIVITMLF